jgi:F-type H+-transporting ATPase subunit delta
MAARRSSARRYAEAISELAQRDGTEDAWSVVLDAAAAALGSPEVLRIVENPAIPIDDRRRAIRTALGVESIGSVVDDLLKGRRSLGSTVSAVRGAALGPVRGQVENLVDLLLDRRRLSLLPAIAREYKRLLDRQRGITEAVVTTPMPLTADDLEAVRAQVQQLAGTTVEIRAEVDPELIGGITIRLGDRLLDVSVRGRLERLRSQLLAGSRPAHSSGA